MKINFNLKGEERKALVKAISELTGVKAIYQGTPSMAYLVDYFTITKEGNLEFDDRADSEEIENLLDGLAERGFTLHDEKLEALAAKLNAVEEPTEDAEKIDYTISIPLEHVDCGKLTRLLEVKGDLIKKALGIDELPIKIDEEKVSFPWFRIEPEYGTCQAAAELVVALCKMSKDQKRITAQKKEVENEKYAFRCFLLRLGFIGKGYKEIRKTLLSNLSGNAAFKGGAK